MSEKQTHALALIGAIDRLLEEYKALRLNPDANVHDSDRVLERWKEVARSSRLGGFGEPPPFADAAIVVNWPYMRVPDSEAADAWVNKLLAVRLKAKGTTKKGKGMSVTEANEKVSNEPAMTASDDLPSVRPKRSTNKNEAQIKIAAAFSAHHEYGSGGCLNWKPIGNNELARKAVVSNSSASTFFNKHFGGHDMVDGHGKYTVLCVRNTKKVLNVIKALNGDFCADDTYGDMKDQEDE